MKRTQARITTAAADLSSDYSDHELSNARNVSAVAQPPTDFPYHELSDVEIEQHVYQLFERGYNIVPASVSPSVLLALQEAAGSCLREGGPVTFGNLPSRSPAFQDLIVAPNILRIVKRVVGEDCLLSSTTLSAPAPAPEQEYHTDDLLYGRDLFQRPLQHYLNINCITALSDFTKENGATKLVPYSHRWSEFPPRGNPQRPAGCPVQSPVNQAFEEEFAARGQPVIQAEMAAGSTVLFVGAIWHCRGPSLLPERSQEEEGTPRRSVVIQYCRGNLRTQENLMLDLSREVVAKMPVVMQRLCGYSPTIDGLGFTSRGFPATLLGEGGQDLLREDKGALRDIARSNFKRLLGHLEHNKRLGSSVHAVGQSIAQGSKEDLEAELAALEGRSHTVSQRMHDLRRELGRRPLAPPSSSSGGSSSSGSSKL